MGESNLLRCQNGHMFSKKKYGTICPFCNVETAVREKKDTEKADKTEADLEEEIFIEDIKPVCGWLICIKGTQKGRSYKIVEGKNFIGRGDDMDIQILGDNRIDRRNHAIVVFDPKKKETMLLPGDTNGLVYLDKNVVYGPKPLSPYMKIELGDSIFSFLPFCGEHFMWGET